MFSPSIPALITPTLKLKRNIFKNRYCTSTVIDMYKMIVMIALLLVAVQGDTFYEIDFPGEELAPIDDVSLCADGKSVYVAYTPPDAADTVVTKLGIDLEELESIRLEGVISPCIKVFDNTMYLVGISGEQIVIKVLTSDLEVITDFTMEIEEPTHVYILPYEEGILLSYVHRFLENDLLRQDVFVKKLDFSFNQLAEARLTNWDYWEDPCLAVYNESILVCYANAPLISILDRHLVIVKLDMDLEKIEEVRHPRQAAMEGDMPIGKTVIQPDMVKVDEGVVILYRIADHNFTTSKWTWQGFTTIVPGNIRGVHITESLEIGEEITISKDFREHYQPAAVSAFGRVYFAHAISEKEVKKLQIISAETFYDLKVEPPSWWETHQYRIAAGTVVGIVVVVVIVEVLKRLVTEKRKEEKKGGRKKK
ncbi:MAG: hypothetical protein AYK18_10395 [Theionarchaea archaeon DG-70]|nr:MAG: hypothetical protein AYK18_10395 [Theionarchaea archaeon DG-70]